MHRRPCGDQEILDHLKHKAETSESRALPESRVPPAELPPGLFVPYAAVTFSFDEFADIVRPVFEVLGYGFQSIHTVEDPVAAVENAEAVAVGGGNTFALLSRMYTARIIEPVRRMAETGMPYMGWSAGCNVACPTIRTTNDMPIVQPPTLDAIGLVPFQINPHFISGKPAGHNGESREERLAEFLAINPGEGLLALPEGSALYVENDTGRVLGERCALHFSGGTEAPASLDENEIFGLDRIAGSASSAK